MNTIELIHEIEKLSVSDKMFVIEKTLHDIRIQEVQQQMVTAVDALLEDYTFDTDLTSFTCLDSEPFYEAR